MIRHFYTVIIVCLLSVSGLMQAQDIHFSQYNASPLMLNPALAGMNTCDYRAYLNYRMQWMTVSTGNTYRTVAGGADMSIGKVTKYNSFAGLGLSFFTDQAGDLNFSTNRVDLSFAYHFMLNRRGTQQISAGLQGSFNYRTINTSKATFDSQYNPTTGLVDPGGTRESLGRTNVMFGEASFGLLYSGLFKNDINFYMGLAMFHLNQPKISFLPSGVQGGDERLYFKTTIHSGLAIPAGKRLVIMPNVMALVQGPSYEFNVGCNFKTLLGSNIATSKTALHLGLQYRGLIDALILHTRVDYKGFSAGFSYDINISKLLPASQSVGAPEISLMYQGCYRKKPRPGHCPAMF